MLAERHAQLVEKFNVVSLLLKIPLLLIFLATNNFVLIIALAVPGIILWLMLWNRPVPCTTPGCSGEMRKNLTQTGFKSATITYHCKSCEAVHVEEIFNMNLEIEVGS